MTSTQYNSADVQTAAANLGKILDDMAPFNDLKPHWPNAGKFELAEWLERIVDDRRNALVAHAEHLRLTFENMETLLTQISEDFETLDEENAAKIKEMLGGLETTIQGAWSEWDENTEADQGNFGGGGGDGNTTVGDGYSANLTIPVGQNDAE